MNYLIMIHYVQIKHAITLDRAILLNKVVTLLLISTKDYLYIIITFST